MSGFVKLDCGILDSTLWANRELREMFITALLMARPAELPVEREQLDVETGEPTGWSVPAGWYGFIAAAAVGIVRRAGIETGAGLMALKQLGEIEIGSRSSDFAGRRVVRIDGGFLVLNFQKYRDHDYTAALRAQRYRDRVKTGSPAVGSKQAPRNIAALAAWAYLLANDGACADVASAAALKYIGGWSVVRMRTNFTARTLRQQFVARYAWQQSTQTGPAAPETTGET